MDSKFALASPDWLDLLREILSDLVQTHGQPGESFSMCEVFLGAPPGSVGYTADGRSTWYLEINGKHLVVAPGERSDVDLKLTLDYAGTLPFSRHVVLENDPGVLQPQIEKTEGNPELTPSYITELHNLLAPRTR